MTYDEQIAIVKEDQLGKLHREDDHGVMDCAADIRELKAEKRGYWLGHSDGVMAGLEMARHQPASQGTALVFANQYQRIGD